MERAFRRPHFAACIFIRVLPRGVSRKSPNRSDASRGVGERRSTTRLTIKFDRVIP